MESSTASATARHAVCKTLAVVLLDRARAKVAQELGWNVSSFVTQNSSPGNSGVRRSTEG